MISLTIMLCYATDVFKKLISQDKFRKSIQPAHKLNITLIKLCLNIINIIYIMVSGDRRVGRVGGLERESWVFP